jgi:hypothetical protein
LTPLLEQIQQQYPYLLQESSFRKALERES